jgi:hypothetical protein
MRQAGKLFVSLLRRFYLHKRSQLFISLHNQTSGAGATICLRNLQADHPNN